MKIVKEILNFILWTILPIALTAGVTALGLLASMAGATLDTATPAEKAAAAEEAAMLRGWAIILAIALGIALIGKAIRDYKWGRTTKKVRHNTVRDLHNHLGPALQAMTELALTEVADKEPRRLMLRDISRQCCNALIALTPETSGLRVAVFEVKPDPDRIAPVAHAGRNEAPRTFAVATAQGKEVLSFLERAQQKPELFRDTRKTMPAHYDGDRERYRSFIRVAIWGDGIVFGMLTVDGPKNALTKEDLKLAELIAGELGAAFAIAAN